MLRQTLKKHKPFFFVFFGVLGTIRVLYTFRHVLFFSHYLSSLVALVLIYPALLHINFTKQPIVFFETNARLVLSSLKTFTATSLVIFPPFLLASHFYQKLILGHHLQIFSPPHMEEEFLIQVVLIAFPEEFFFRGYVQETLKKLSSPRTAILLTSILFAGAHSFIALQWWHFAIFFPALVFGWLREKTNGLVAPILFHAVSNTLMFWIQACYR